ncbi:protein pigeon [Coccinella septempunctata]|uniref:protein pigeon n=1 Tax=Coccinella septempunctata TaxID=41139 RepID=UPI001D05CA87|nr:protein pigeon [Coccinella septempunctata]
MRLSAHSHKLSYEFRCFPSMVIVDNFIPKLYPLVTDQENFDPTEDLVTDWRLIGQEQNGDLLFSWTHKSDKNSDHTRIGCYNLTKNHLDVVHTFSQITNCIQASIDDTKTYLTFVVKNIEDDIFTYKPYIIHLHRNIIVDLNMERSKQIMIQFLYQKTSLLSEKTTTKFLILVHQECILQYQIKSQSTEFNMNSFSYESIVRIFTWAQWDPMNQILYYIHNKKPSRSIVEGDEAPPSIISSKSSPTLSGLQFHDDLPHESVLNIPLNLPHANTLNNSGNLYEDDAVPLRIHDCTLDLIVVTNEDGFVCICHHYLYQPIQPTDDSVQDDESLVHFAYSVTVLHQSCVLQCVVPGLPFKKAKTIRPVFKRHGNHMLVFIPEVCTQLLDIGIKHEPCCHVSLKPFLTETPSFMLCLAPLAAYDNLVNIATLDVIDFEITKELLVDAFKNEQGLDNKIAIIHFLMQHLEEADTALELIMWHTQMVLKLDWSQLLKEYLIGCSYASLQKNLPPDANHLLNLLPITTQHIGKDLEVKIEDKTICLSQDMLWNTSMMLLSPQQRIIPYRSDMWIKLWEQLALVLKGKQRFRPAQVVEKLRVSLVCYQPEALSRSSTPMSPAGPITSSILNELCGMQGTRKGLEELPFYEIENCTASRQEHIISVNLRELSMHLLKQSSDNKITRFQWQNQSPMHVHAVATRYVSAQLEQSRRLCQALCQKAVSTDPRHPLEKGFLYIDQMNEEDRLVLFSILERYYLAIESIAYPQPQGFTSFFSFLGYKTLSFEMFLQYVNRNVFELQVDVMKAIMTDIPNDSRGVNQKLKLLSILPRSRAKRLLNQWQHPISLMLRAREHALNILSGVESGTGKGNFSSNKHYKNLSPTPSEQRLPALDTFLDLLTAKASLTDLDFGLLIEATESSVEEFQ